MKENSTVIAKYDDDMDRLAEGTNITSPSSQYMTDSPNIYLINLFSEASKSELIRNISASIHLSSFPGNQSVVLYI